MNNPATWSKAPEYEKFIIPISACEIYITYSTLLEVHLDAINYIVSLFELDASAVTWVWN